MTTLLPLLEGANILPIPAWGFGLLFFGALALGLLFVLHLGSSRPHS